MKILFKGTWFQIVEKFINPDNDKSVKYILYQNKLIESHTYRDINKTETMKTMKIIVRIYENIKKNLCKRTNEILDTLLENFYNAFQNSLTCFHIYESNVCTHR